MSLPFCRLFLLLVALSALPALVAAAADGPPREGLRLWLDAADSGTVTQSAGLVIEWRDKSNDHRPVKTVGKPTIAPEPFGGKAAIRLAGNECFTTTPISDKAGPVSIFVVSRRLSEQAGGAGWQRLVSINGGSGPDNKPPAVCLTTDAQSPAYLAAIKVLTQDAIAPGPLAIGCVVGREPRGGGFRGDVAEVLVYNRGFLSEGAVMEVLDYLGKKWQATPDRKNTGWTRTGPLADCPPRRNELWPLSDQANAAGWIPCPAFSDEFAGTTLDEEKWVSPYKWKGRPPAPFVRSNVSVSGDNLELAMRREEAPLMKKDPKYHTYTSAYVATRKLTRYGYFEVRAKPMNSAGSSSFWFSHGNKNWGIEIDVFEIGGKAIGRERAYNMNAHVFRENGKQDHWNTGGKWEAPWRLADDFHTYGLEWTPKRLAYYVDGALVRTMPNTHWHKPMNLIFDSETMPDWFGLPRDEDLPSIFQVDYVRTWKLPGWEGALTEAEADAGQWEALAH